MNEVERRKFLAKLNNERYVRMEDYFFTVRGFVVLIGSFFVSFVLLGFVFDDWILRAGIFIGLSYILMIFFPVDFTEKERPFYFVIAEEVKPWLRRFLR